MKKNKPLPPLMREEETKSNKRRSIENEARMSKLVGAKLTANSGALPHASMKGDFQSEDFVWQDKLTSGKRLVLTSKDLAEVCRQAAQLGKWPALTLTLEGAPLGIEKAWVAIPAHVWTELTETS